MLRQLRWPLAGTIAIAFALGQLLETLLLTGAQSRSLLLLDVVGWGALGGLAVWLSLTWVGRQEHRFQESITRSLHEQQALNNRLQRANKHLTLLSDVNRRIADSATLDEILDGTLSFPARLLDIHVGVLSLNDAAGPIETRAHGATVDELTRLRERFGVRAPQLDQRRLQVFQTDDLDGCILLPIHDGQTQIGFAELYLRNMPHLQPDEQALLETIASEIAEAIVSARRRSREERAIYELERAIADERARIARDIHDGITQTLAFRRMRIDLWLDWLDTDREQLRTELIESKQLLREQISELRRAIFALRPVQFDELGFVGGLHRYVIEWAGQHGWTIDVDLAGAPSTLAPTIEAATFRVLQESLTNIAKHAQATHVEVSIDQIDNGLRLVVR
ncbi:MAG: Sensor histidine kinase, partial [uncultured Chloroflexia bacterium]